MGRVKNNLLHNLLIIMFCPQELTDPPLCLCAHAINSRCLTLVDNTIKGHLICLRQFHYQISIRALVRFSSEIRV